ncbi:MAG: MBL fold metallo-hydrolase [Faecalibacterium sp.]
MYELTQVGARTYYINCPAKMGVYKLNETDICLIDSGNDKDAARKLLKIFAAEGWMLKLIINTHSHADHIGGNALLQQRTGCAIYTVGTEVAFTNEPFLEAAFLYGGYPCKPLRNKFLRAQESTALPLTEDVLPEGLTLLRLDGHSFAMAAIKTADDIWFLADCLTSETILQKYHVSFLYDVAAYKQSLTLINTLEGKLFIPAHAEPTSDIHPLADANLAKVAELTDLLLHLCATPTPFEDILKQVFDHYALTMDFNQNVLVGSTLRSYLAYLYDAEQVEAVFHENKLHWCAVPHV